MTKAGAGFVMPDQPHYLDHIGVICAIMNVPLLCVDGADEALAKRCYPNIETELVPYDTFSPEYLIKQFDILYNTDLWDRDLFQREHGPLMEELNKRVRMVHCPHGFSDKGFYLAKAAKEDIALIYGQNMLDQMKEEGVDDLLQDHVITGNYRWTYFQQHRPFYEKLFNEEVQFAKEQPLILYAPTWQDLEDSTTFFDSARTLLDALPDHYNLLVKLHPHLEFLSETVADYYQIIGQYESRPNVLFLREYPAIYSLLAHTDIYIGDMSSIGYDFLLFNKPMFFLNKHQRDVASDRRAFLYRCGVPVNPNEYSSLFPLIEEHLSFDQERFSTIRKETYAYTFGAEKPLETLRKEILDITK